MAVSLGEKAAFNGESFSDMIAPLKEYATAYNAAEQQYDNLAMQTELVKQMMDSEPEGSKAKQQYTAYYQGLRNAVDDFSRGMSMANRSALTGLKRNYARDVVPINQAVEAKKKLITQADSIGSAAKGANDVVWQRDPNTITLDELIANPATGLGSWFSKSGVSDYTEGASKYLSKELKEVIDKILGYSTSETANALGKTTTTTEKHQQLFRNGYSEREIRDAISAIAADPNVQSDNALYDIYRQGMNFAIGNWADATDEQKRAAHNAVIHGLWAAIGGTTPHDYDLSTAVYEPHGTLTGSGNDADDGTTYNPHHLFAPGEIKTNGMSVPQDGLVTSFLADVQKGILNHQITGSGTENDPYELVEGSSFLTDLNKKYGTRYQSIQDLNDAMGDITVNDVALKGIQDAFNTVAKRTYWTMNIDPSQRENLKIALSRGKYVLKFDGYDADGKPIFKRLTDKEQNTWAKFLNRTRKSGKTEINYGDNINQFWIIPNVGIAVSITVAGGNEGTKEDVFMVPEDANPTLYGKITKMANTLYQKDDNGNLIVDKEAKDKIKEIYDIIPSFYTSTKNRGTTVNPAYAGQTSDQYALLGQDE